MKKLSGYIFLLLSVAVFCVICISLFRLACKDSRLNSEIITTDQFRKQPVDDYAAHWISELNQPGEHLAVYWLETGFGREKAILSEDRFMLLKKRWENVRGWDAYVRACRAVWDDLKYFPVAESAGNPGYFVSFENSWMFERTYGGNRFHEGTDIMPSVNESGLFPIVSITDGTVENIGWLKLGGWRIGIRADHGGYFYYAHLDSYADIQKGSTVKAGDFLGFMGDSGYGKEEGTTGKFPVHLHIGIYLNEKNSEISINPYPVLKYLEGRTLKAVF